MARFICPRCRRDVIADADLEGEAADCARCGAHVARWPAPKRKTRKPRGPLATLLDFGVFAAALVLALVFSVGVFGRDGLGIVLVVLVVLVIVKAVFR